MRESIEGNVLWERWCIQRQKAVLTPRAADVAIIALIQRFHPHLGSLLGEYGNHAPATRLTQIVMPPRRKEGPPSQNLFALCIRFGGVRQAPNGAGDRVNLRGKIAFQR